MSTGRGLSYARRVADSSPAPRSREPRSREHWLILGIGAVALIGMLALGAIVSPDARGHGTHEQLGLPPCMTMELWSIPCPGCGVTTSVTLASQGRFLDSFVNQPFGLTVWLGVIAFALWAFAQHVRGIDIYRDLRGRRAAPLVFAAAGIAGASWVYKLVQAATV